MKHLFTLILSSAFLTLSAGEATQAATLGAESFSSAGGSADIFKDYQLTLTIGSASDRFPSNAPLFNGLRVTPADVGRTFTVNATTDANFNNFVAFLTDGEPDGIEMQTGTGTLGLVGGALGISGNLFGGNPDLAGNNIDSISLRINALSLNSPGINPNGDGIWTDELFNATLSVEGKPINHHPPVSVPEPSSLLGIFAFGAWGSGFLFKRRR